MVLLHDRSWDTGHGQSWDNSMAAMSMFSMADLPSVRDAKARCSKASASNSRPRSAAGTSGFGSTKSANSDLVLARKAKGDRLESLLRQARLEGLQVEGDMRTVIQEEVQRQLRSATGFERTKTPDGRQSHTRAYRRTSSARHSSAGLSRSSRHGHGARHRQVSSHKRNCESGTHRS